MQVKALTEQERSRLRDLRVAVADGEAAEVELAHFTSDVLNRCFPTALSPFNRTKFDDSGMYVVRYDPVAETP